MLTKTGSQVWHILLVDDDEDDYILVKSWLTESKKNKFKLDWVSRYDDAIDATSESEYNVLLVDYDLGAYTGLELTRALVERGVSAPIILFTGRGSYEIDIEAMEAGAADYLAKNDMSGPLLERSIRYAISHHQIEAELRKARDELEVRVVERTQALIDRNETLIKEIQARRRIEKELSEVQGRLIDRLEAERLEIARDLHDGPMQEIYALQYKLAAFPYDGGRDEQQRFLEEIVERLGGMVRSMRALAGELRPPALAPYGLEKAIRSHASDAVAAYPGLDLHLELEEDGQNLPQRMRLALFRIYQVALTNVLRHAEADQIWVRLSFSEKQVVMEIEDDGQGFDVPERWFQFALQGHLGLAGAEERASAIGGSLEVESQPGRGTRIRVTAPRSVEARPAEPIPAD